MKKLKKDEKLELLRKVYIEGLQRNIMTSIDLFTYITEMTRPDVLWAIFNTEFSQEEKEYFKHIITEHTENNHEENDEQSE